MDLFGQFFLECWNILRDLSLPLLLGLLIAGLLHVFLPKSFIHRRLSKSSLGSVLQAVVLGIPLPLCSCGVLPTALGLKREGASKGAATGFLISTPQTGVDSILVTASFLGWPFAFFKVLVAFISGMLGGVLVNIFDKNELPDSESSCASQDNGQSERSKLSEALHFAVFDLLKMIDLSLIVGVAAAAVLVMIFPPGHLHAFQWTQGISGMLVALAISLPLYVCTTSSVPIAAALIAAGMPTGTALVFLMAGPATNIATMTMVYRGLGGKVLSIYVGSVAVLSIVFGLYFDWLLGNTKVSQTIHHAHEPSFFANLGAVILLLLLALLFVQRFRSKTDTPQEEIKDPATHYVLKVAGMRCMHCVTNIKKSIESLPGVVEAIPDLESKEVDISGTNLDLELLKATIAQAGYKVSDA